MTLRKMLVLMGALLLAGTARSGDVTVSAAASLTDAFKAVAAAFEQAHPETQLKLNFAASGVLLQQISRGAPADLFASADQKTMDDAADQGLLVPATRRDFVRNALVLITPAQADAQLDGLAALATAPVKRIALGNPDYVPAGRYGKKALERAGLWPHVAGKIIPAQNVRQVLDYVVRGEVDAGLVYATDAHLMGDKLHVVADIALDEPITYPIAVIAGSANVGEAQRFIDFILSPQGQDILVAHGFAVPH